MSATHSNARALSIPHHLDELYYGREWLQTPVYSERQRASLVRRVRSPTSPWAYLGRPMTTQRGAMTYQSSYKPSAARILDFKSPARRLTMSAESKTLQTSKDGVRSSEPSGEVATTYISILRFRGCWASPFPEYSSCVLGTDCQVARGPAS